MNALLAGLSPKALRMLERSVEASQMQGSATPSAAMILSLSRDKRHKINPEQRKRIRPNSVLEQLQQDVLAPLVPFTVAKEAAQSSDVLLVRSTVDALWTFIHQHVLDKDLLAALNAADMLAQQEEHQRLAQDLQQMQLYLQNTAAPPVSEKALQASPETGNGEAAILRELPKNASTNKSRLVKEICAEIAPKLRQQLQSKGAALLQEMQKKLPETASLRQQLGATANTTEFAKLLAVLGAAKPLQELLAALPSLHSAQLELKSEAAETAFEYVLSYPDQAKLLAVLLHQRLSGNNTQLLELANHLRSYAAPLALPQRQSANQAADAWQAFAFEMLMADLRGAEVWRHAAYAELGYPEAVEAVLSSIHDMGQLLSVQPDSAAQAQLTACLEPLKQSLNEEFDMLLSHIMTALNAPDRDDVIASASFKRALRALRVLKVSAPFADLLDMKAQISALDDRLEQLALRQSEKLLQARRRHKAKTGADSSHAELDLRFERLITLFENYWGQSKANAMRNALTATGR
ncbi:hypothetical protein [Polycladidibacter hongkongensis]|uniref:hypothetical protein n=1 Tax=Polycladidibacter hongkongensis TaxID=1647556 RepID=UPI0012E346B3|nr:hypothetical protein [Pseudovibrio hongkongensis]